MPPPKNPIDMLYVPLGEGRKRKFRLFACACCRRLWHLLADESRHAIQVTERYADGNATADDLLRAFRGTYPGENLVHRLAVSDDLRGSREKPLNLPRNVIVYKSALAPAAIKMAMEAAI